MPHTHIKWYANPSWLPLPKLTSVHFMNSLLFFHFVKSNWHSLPLCCTHTQTHTLVHTQPDRAAWCGMILINNNYELTQSENLIACWLRICQIPQPWGGRVQRARGLAVANDFIRCLQTVAYGCGIAYTRSCAARILSHGKAIRRRVRALGCNIWLASTWLH